MKYYKITPSITINGHVPPGMNGETVKGKELFFRGKCGPDKFFDKMYEFDYLTPVNVGGDWYEEQPVLGIYHYHMWIIEEPFGGWLKPISKNLKEILEKFNLGEHRFYTAWVLFNGIKHPYFVMQILDNEYQKHIDFEKTLFNNLNSSRDIKNRVFETYSLQSVDAASEYARAKSGSSANWNYERIVMKPEFKEFDFFTFYKLGDVVSERLKKAIEEAGLIGIEFVELPIPIEFSDEV
jgi:hypothetical protein